MATVAFRAPGKILFGAGALGSLGPEARRLGRRAVLATGRRAMAEAGVTERCLAALAEAGVDAALFDQVEPEPDVTTVDRLREAVRAHGADLVVGLGGGSALDAAKAAAGLAREDEPTAAYHQGKPITRPALPNIAIPSTSGTGSEMTTNSVLTDRRRQVKTSIRADGLIPAVAIVDPEVTRSSPPFVTATSGVDALVQAIESYLARGATPLTEALSVRAMEELAAALPAVVQRGEDLALRTRAAWGSAMAGLALANARLGAAHALAHPLGARFSVPHGLACGVLLAPVLEFNRPAAPAKYAAMERVFGGDPAAYARRLLTECGLPAKLTDYGLTADVLGPVAEETLPSGTLKANPRTATKEDLVGLLRALI